MRGQVLTSRFPAVASRVSSAKRRRGGGRSASWLGLLAVFVTAAAWGAETPTEAPPSVRAVVASREANLVRVNGRPAVLMWARGVADVGDLDRYAAAGMNTAYVLIQGVSEEDLQRASSLAAAAEGKGLMVVAAVAPRALSDAEGNELAADPLSEEYGAAVKEFVRKAVEGLGEHPAMIAWSVEAVPPDQVVWSDEGFRAYLDDWYGSLESLNYSWGTDFEEWEEIAVAGVEDIDQTNPGGLGRATVDFALYREAAYADVLSLWAQAIRQADPGRLVFASALTDYRSIISVRMDFDGMVLNTYPSQAEVDWQTHNVHAVDIARRANEFAVVQTLEVGSDTDARSVLNWASLALHHGATGIAFSDWGAVRDSEGLRAAVAEIVRGLEELAYFPAQPRPRAAILYEPLAGGAMREGQGLYGYLDGFTPNEPSTLFSIGRSGSRYGQFDVLALSSLGEADLEQYGVIIAPMALYLPQDAQMALHNYVMAGGTLVTDAGVGMYQADGLLTSMPEVMKQVLGVRAGVDEEAWSAPAPGEVQVGETGNLGVPLMELPEEAGTADNRDLERLADIVDEVLDRPMVADYLGVDFLSDEAPDLRVNALGQGVAVYAPWFLYEDWNASDPYFVEFHARVLSQGSDLELTEPADLWPGVSAGVYSDWSVGLASPDGVAAAVALYGAGNQVYSVPAGAARLGNPEEGDWVELLFPGLALSVARPVPIYVRTADEEAVATVSVVRYDAGRIELLVHGSGARATVAQDGVAVSGGVRTPVEIEVQDGEYRVSPGSVHKVVVKEGTAGRLSWDREAIPNPETGSLVIQGTFIGSRVTIEPAAEES